MAVALLLILGIITVCFYINYQRTKRFRMLANKLPGPPALPFFGNSLEIKKTDGGVLQYLVNSQNKYGKVTRHWLGLGSLTMYTLLTDPKDIEVLLRDTKNLSKSQNYDFLKPWLGQGLVTGAGNHWHTHRKIITPAFHFNILEKFVEVFNEKGKKLIEKLKEKVGQEEFDVYPYISFYALDAIIETAMGIKYRAQDESDSDYVQALHEIMKIAHHRSFSFIHRCNLTFPHTKLGKRQKEVLDIIHGYCNKILYQRKEELEGNPSQIEDDPDDIGRKRRFAFLDLLLKGQKEGSGLSDQDIREEVDTFMFAGHDTTTSAISFSLYYLAHNPEVQQKAFEEIKLVLGDTIRDLKLADLQNLKYLDQVTKESLRIAPAIPFVSRRLEFDLQLNNYTLPAGSSAGVFIYHLHRDPQIYPNPEKFDPERFSDKNVLGRHPYAYVPFSAGPRNCIGQKYAQLEIKSTLVKILWNFQLFPGKRIEKLTGQITLKSSNGSRIRIEKRK